MDFQIYVDYITKQIRTFFKSGQSVPLPENIDADIFLAFCRFHKIENLIYLTMQKAEVPKHIKDAFQKLYLHSISIMAKQQYYIEKIEKEFEKAEIDYFVMKGRELSKFYPSPDMRQSSDFDIYVGNEKAALAKDIMVGLGFEVQFYAENSGHDKYFIDKSVLCEVHRVLIEEEFPWRNECNKIPDRTIRCENTKHCYHMNKEDFYLYNLAHAANHMMAAGVGIKTFIDLWLIYTKYKHQFDYTYLNEKLKSANLTKFEECSRALFLYWFEGKATNDPTIKAMAEFVANSGWIGTYNQYASAKLARESSEISSSMFAKLHSYRKIIFLSYTDLANRYPRVEKHKILVPYYYVYRIFKALFGKDKGAKRVVSQISTGDLEKGKDILKLKKDIGL